MWNLLNETHDGVDISRRRCKLVKFRIYLTKLIPDRNLTLGHSAYWESGLYRCRPWPPAPRPPLLANPNLFRNPNTVFESTYLCTATTKSLFPTAPGLQIPRSTETKSLIDSSTFLYLHFYIGHAHPLILSLTVLRVQLQLSGTHCLLLLGLLIVSVLLGLDLKLTYSPKPMPPIAYL